MAAINMYLGRRFELASTVSRSSTSWRLDFSIALRDSAAAQDIMLMMQRGGDGFQARIGVASLTDFNGRDVSRIRVINDDQTAIYEEENRTLNDGEFHTVSYRCNGSTVTMYIDGVQRGSSNAVVGAPTLSPIGTIGHDWAEFPANAFNEFNQYDLEWIRLYDSADTSSLIHHWSADDSNTGNTGAQPILVDIVGGNNATGVGFPTDGSAWVLPPALTFLSAPAVVDGSITSSGAQIQLTTSLAATVKVQDTAAGSSQPDPSTFTGITATGTTTGSTVFTFSVTGQSASTTRRKWLEVSNGTTTLYASVDVTTIAASTTITAVNGGAPIRYGQATVDVTWDTAPETPGSLTINGVAQSSHVAVDGTTTRFGPLVWPNVMYGETATLSANGSSITTPQFTTAVGYDYVTLSGYTENPPATPDVATALGDASAVAVNGDQFVYDTESGEVTIASNGTLSFGAGFDGTVTIAIVDSADGAHSDFVTLYYGESLDLVPTIPAFSSLTNQEPGVEIIDSFVVADVTAGQDITFAATGSMTVSTSNSGPWSSSVVRQLGQTVYRRMVTGTFGQSVTGGVSSGGQSQSCTYTTRAAVAPTGITPAQPASVTQGAQASFTIAGTGIATVEWSVNGTVDPSQTGLTFTTTQNTPGTYTIGWVPRSAEGGAAPQGTTTLTVIAAATRLQIPEIKNPVTGAVRSNQQIPVRVFGVSGSTRTQRLATTITTAASGGTQLDSNQIGAIGEQVEIEYLGTDGTWVGQTLTVVAAS